VLKFLDNQFSMDIEKLFSDFPVLAEEERTAA